MKNLKLYLLFILSVITATGCDEEDFLDETNPNAITTDTFWENAAQFNAGLNTVYGALQFGSISGSGLVFEMILGDIGGTESWYRPFAFRNLTYTDAQEHVRLKWNDLYVGIFRANQVIQFINENEVSDFRERQREQIEAQARFLRAFFYFQLAHTYGGAVIHTEISVEAADFKKPFSDIATVNSEIITPDLEFAIANLPRQWEGSNVGRVTWGAAVSLLGKVHLYDENWSEAAGRFKEVIDANIYSLVPNVMDNYTDENEFNAESIFEVNFSSTLKPGINGNAVDDSPWESGAEATTIATAMGQLSFGAFNTLLPSYYLHELFVFDEMDPSNAGNFGLTQSQRMGASIVPTNGDGLYYQLPIGERGGWAFGQSAYIKKHSNWYQWSSEDPNNRSGINFRHIRLADVYLMYAEAILQASGDAAVTEAMSYIDRVRARAGVITLDQYRNDNAGQIPELHISVQVHGPRTFTNPTAETVLTHIMKVERPVELCFEGHRWKDLVRWGMVKEQFDALRADEKWREDNFDTIEGEEPLLVVERIRPDFILSSQNYSPDVHNYFPIPTGEKQINDQLGG
ncbi:RagB/SusD family nutrient uptake outer membrane protein [Fulvivirga sp. M361]|uniref:RagB/SusD family nutrient uptake outer membrane protein n=1 Tax=Fulvivirga sp. M361 TaxID=2594266 RepID=UPI00117BBCFE|nr:RagB/SusD family nutrient uptake outer membrane protein [Fulvivirga sp. M361]TRX59967.1 RagB/SusD family nutrient uptake outer membrane protein [Fulvivirga sp. M361]